MSVVYFILFSPKNKERIHERNKEEGFFFPFDSVLQVRFGIQDGLRGLLCKSYLSLFSCFIK